MIYPFNKVSSQSSILCMKYLVDKVFRQQGIQLMKYYFYKVFPWQSIKLALNTVAKYSVYKVSGQ
jgi:hypothetical protein